MPRRSTPPPAPGVRTAVGQVVQIVRIALYAVLGLLALLTLSEVPVVSRWMRGLGSQRPLVGVLAGHWQNDSGAICPDGLQEVEINLAVARRAAQLLREQGYDAEVLPEYSSKLSGYRADAFVAIHCDSCLDGYSGYKVASLSGSSASGRLLSDVSEAYALATGLPSHPDTITDDMRQYHALRQIDASTPGVIIECGFMGGDRYLLTEEQDRVAVGIANGVMAFLRRTAPPTTGAP
ncbi:MAG: N-acetylmuramoyl-L-alanine amidase [Chloroflexi bacterium]|nr:N-acetylmuramoyl-L-alanine amidase [Chloroflexota bacterium]